MQRAKRETILKKHVMGLFLIPFLLQIGILCAFGVYSILNAKEREAASLRHILAIYKTVLEESLEQADHDLGDILSRKFTLQVLKNESELQRRHAEVELLSLMENKISVGKRADAYVIADGVHQSFLMARSGTITYREIGELEQFFKKTLGETAREQKWGSIRLSDKTYLLHYYYYSQMTVGAVISETTLRALIPPDQQGEYAFRLLDDKGRVAYASAGQGHLEPAGNGLVRKDPVYHNAFYLEGESRMFGISRIGRSLFSGLFLAVVGLIFISGLSVFLFRRFVRREIVAPLGEMTEITEAVKNGNWERKACLTCGNKEFLQLGAAYNNMIDTVLALKLEKYERIIRLKDAELKYLHMQLKPHFFLNVLSSINSLSYQHKDEEIRKFVQALSANIRYMFRTGLHTVALKEEMNYIGNYLEIQKLLYRDCFYFYADVEKESEDWPVPQMMLHTFLENVFKHAITMNSFTTIFLQCKKIEKMGLLCLGLQWRMMEDAFPMRFWNVFLPIRENVWMRAAEWGCLT